MIFSKVMDVIEDFFPQSILRETKKKPISTLAGAVMIFPGDWMMASSGARRLSPRSIRRAAQ
ncbi:UNVERIFIED_ORG: hypothetical protein QE446_003389 [Rhizobium sp. SORGH_AS260]|uniref:hypothetical protein n=1 Tax=Agrobacterium TaxID=357 RepID=UPI00129A38DF|nr:MULTISPECIES: hypothetical protein [Agrobacterium]MDP9732659.1 hypothetical protein [Rhizobium sp. SORGH_AS_0285]MDP9755513.1 hypothetical protein [Rhizobium sp. SORGH_AS_0260]MDR6081830.1 hypothetical protein [Agrobacterium sp. SORGH_AS_0440]MRG67683.1 hypothetical protein [Agrobacterium pusense]